MMKDVAINVEFRGGDPISLSSSRINKPNSSRKTQITRLSVFDSHTGSVQKFSASLLFR